MGAVFLQIATYFGNAIITEFELPPILMAHQQLVNRKTFHYILLRITLLIIK